MTDSRKKKSIDYLINRLDEIDSKYPELKDKNTQWKNAVKKVKRELRDEDDKGNLAISLNTYHSYLGDIRDAVKQTGRKHFGLTSTLSRKGYIQGVIKLLPAYEDDLRGIAAMPASTIHKGVKALKAKIKDELNGTPRNEAVSALKKLLIHHPVVMMLEKEDAEKEDRAQAKTESLEAKTENKKIYNAPKLIETALSLLDAKSYTARAWALALLTGRRSVEIMYHAEFKYISDNTVMFSGQTKKSAGTNNKPYPIPVLADSKLIIDALKSFRKMDEVIIFKNGSGSYDWHEDVKYSTLRSRDLNKAINQRTNGVLNARAKKITDDKAEVFKNTRIIYAEYCKHNMRNLTPEWSAMADDSYLRAILGHDQLGEVKHYNQAEVRNEPDAEWLKIPEPETDDQNEKEDEQKTVVKQNRRAMSGFADMSQSVKSYPESFVEIAINEATTRKVKINKVREFHWDLSTWAAENPELKITQTVVTKNKGNTASSGTGTVDLKANRYTFQAWEAVVGKDALEAYNNGKD